jgi:hypothetical protein
VLPRTSAWLQTTARTGSVRRGPAADAPFGPPHGHAERRQTSPKKSSTPEDPAKPTKRLRCAIYTRVSTEYGLDQEFNSLDAQHEASEAYIRSQAHDGWTLIRTRYDDGGYSGGSTDRNPRSQTRTRLRRQSNPSPPALPNSPGKGLPRPETGQGFWAATYFSTPQRHDAVQR